MMMLTYCPGLTYLVSVQKRKNTQSWGPAQTSYFYSAELNLGIKLYERTEEARCLNQTECKHLSLTSSAVPHDSAWLCRQTKSAHQTVIQMSCYCRAKKYHTYVFWRDFFPAWYGENFYVASEKYLTSVWLWHKGSFVLQRNLCAITFCRAEVQCLL